MRSPVSSTGRRPTTVSTRRSEHREIQAMWFRVFHLPTVLLIALASFRAEAQVQSFSATNVEVFIERARKIQSERLFINQRQCQGIDESGAGSAEIRVQITNLGEMAPLANVLEFWLG